VDRGAVLQASDRGWQLAKRDEHRRGRGAEYAGVRGEVGEPVECPTPQNWMIRGVRI
jgi:hypothetical protein